MSSRVLSASCQSWSLVTALGFQATVMEPREELLNSSMFSISQGIRAPPQCKSCVTCTWTPYLCGALQLHTVHCWKLLVPYHTVPKELSLLELCEGSWESQWAGSLTRAWGNDKSICLICGGTQRFGRENNPEVQVGCQIKPRLIWDCLPEGMFDPAQNLEYRGTVSFPHLNMHHFSAQNVWQ